MQPTTVVEHGCLARLSPVERQYVLRSMKRKERTSVVKVLDADTKRLCCAPLRIQVLQSALPERVRMQIFDALATCTSDKYLQWVKRALQLPLGRRAPRRPAASPAEAVRVAKQQMDAVATGFAEVKLEILKLVCQQAHGAPCAGAYSIGLEGPPGTGKTHFARNAVARALGRPMVTIPLGGATDISYLLGIMYSYEGSKEGRLASGLIEAGCCDPVVYFDEVDKISDTDRGRELAAVLIHLVDPTANSALRDRYFHGVDIDFSKCTFVFSYNDAARVSPILLDRMKTYRVAPPTRTERRAILTDHIVPRVARRLATPLTLSDEALDYLAEVSALRDEGMRGAEKDVDDVLALAQLAHAGGAPEAEAHVTKAFVKSVVKAKAPACSAPPPHMYT